MITLFSNPYGMGSHASDVRSEAIDAIYGEVRNKPSRASQIGQIASEAAKMFDSSNRKFGGGVFNPMQYQEALDAIKEIAGGSTKAIDHNTIFNTETMKTGEAGKFFDSLAKRMAAISATGGTSILGNVTQNVGWVIPSPLLGAALDVVKTPDIAKDIDSLNLNDALLANSVGRNLAMELRPHEMGIDKFSQLTFNGHEQFREIQPDLTAQLNRFNEIDVQKQISDVVKENVVEGKMNPELFKEPGLPGMEQQKGLVQQVFGEKEGLDKALDLKQRPEERVEAVQKLAQSESFGFKEQGVAGAERNQNFDSMLKGMNTNQMASLNQMSVAESAQQTAGVSPTMVQNQQSQQQSPAMMA